MNVSSIIIKVPAASDIEGVKAAVNEIEGCEVAAAENGKIVATIESADINEEIARFRAIEGVRGVSDVVMVYSYQDLDDDINRAKNNDIEAIVRAMDAGDIDNIKYSGKLPV